MKVIDYLKSVSFALPNSDQSFERKFLALLAAFGDVENGTLRFMSSSSDLLPKISIGFSSVQKPLVRFEADEALEVEIANKTGEERASLEAYRPVSLSEVADRLLGAVFGKLDHVGFNLPWFAGVQPTIIKVRQRMSPRCAYYRFPTGEEWDFILPATRQEIEARTIDLSIERRPKLEIVSFDKTSTPLIQIDFSIKQNFEAMRTLFPEGIADAQLKNVWVYVQNPYGIDICLVIGEESAGTGVHFLMAID